MSNVRDLHDLGGEKKAEGKEFYAHGGSSGLAVIKPDDPMAAIAAQAQEGGAGVLPPPGSRHVITLYKNGFKVDDGPFRPADDPLNRHFLNDLAQGYVPRELQSILTGPEVGVEIIKKLDEFVQVPFAGQGFGLGGSRGVSSGAAFSTARPNPNVPVDESRPTTIIQITTHDRKRFRQKFNTSHTVLDIYQYVMAVSGHNGPFDLVEGFPPKVLSDPMATIEAAGLKGASITQRTT